MTILVLHGHHHNPNGCPLSILVSIESRIEEINTIKIAKERPTRLLLIRPVDPSELPPQSLKAWEACDAWAPLEAWEKAVKALVESKTPQEWGEWHRTHCGGVALGVCGWTPEDPSIL